jgi:glycine dehydrogenase subunit 1
MRQKRLRGLPEYRVLNEGPFFREFVLQCPGEAEEIVERLGSEGIIPGFRFPAISRIGRTIFWCV